ncbi:MULTISPECIES: N-methyl-L-tryptophan oxidase [unclassified Lysinibacillus]|uniref:N-methyl-L-tryptophan oxidase n=1 Tax=unclassified Lysinibacillus TaxID=2636778 RepID=UPI0020131D1E|nr:MULTISPECIES: N-methyl-L-tryptophan oxidase [unclassified Lysinibacillus]MCL1696675.1 N-methyl-L-tryptophan oxidase [Lysinibacillus sp. BPa_S21]MCL1698844.1 N-methyl-L-tryptophan oxidase [Lysinibacillus sp. Bpr_S20]
MIYDVIVIGAGSMGMAAGYHLAKAGKNVLMLDAFNPPHEEGSHHGETRIIRFAYGEGASYVPFVKRAGELWRELETLTSEALFLQTGVINVGEETHPFIQNVKTSAKLYDLALEQYSAAEAMEKWPGLSLPKNFVACFEPTAGVLRVEACISAYKKLALEAGATLHTNEKVQSINAGAIVRVQTATNIYEAKHLIVTAGAWTTELLQTMDIAIPVTPTRKTFAWFEADEQLYREDIFPAYCFEFADSMYYGFPSIDGAGLKLGRHDGGEAINPNEPLCPFDEQDSVDLQNFIQRFMPQHGALKYGKTCKYSMTPDENFIIDFLPEHQNIVIAAGFSGHGFKFSSAVGEVLADLTLHGKSKQDLSLFKLSRFNTN